MAQQLTDAPFPSPHAKAEYERIYSLWSNGDQDQAEEALVAAVRRFPDCVRIFFFLAVCARSRFSVLNGTVESDAEPLLDHLAKQPPKSRQVRASTLALALDRGQNLDENYDKLRALALTSKPHDPLLLWLFAIEARTFDQPDDGIAAYRALFGLVRMGSPLLHQTFANMLDAKGKYAESLPHRRKAVQMSPAWWSKDGLAGTLNKAGLWKEAEAQFRENVRLYGDNALVVSNYGRALVAHKRFADAEPLLRRAAQLDPHLSNVWTGLAEFSIASGHPAEALPYYRRAIQAAPRIASLRDQAVALLKRLGRPADAERVAKGELPPEK